MQPQRRDERNGRCSGGLRWMARKPVIAPAVVPASIRSCLVVALVAPLRCKSNVRTMIPSDIVLLETKLADPLWRLTSGELYCIKPAGGPLQPFRPRPEQVAVMQAVHADGARQILIPKARRLGMSTTIGIMVADALIFRRGWQGSLIEQSQADASLKLNNIVKVALENLPAWLRQRLTFGKWNDSMVEVDLCGTGASAFHAGKNARGGSNDWLWISEWGPIQFDDPRRSAEIRSGALPSARHGVTIIETTWKGGRHGDLWDILAPTLEGRADDWRVLFFPWWLDPRNTSGTARMDAEADAYFAKIAPRLEREGIALSEGQRRWWAAERRNQGIFMARENPTFLDECWASPVPGAVYAESIERARAEGRVASFAVDGSALVHTFWDLGAPENTVVWYAQAVGRELRVIDCDRGEQGTLAQRVARMLAKGYNYGRHYFPHDARQTERTGTTMLTELGKLLPPSTLVTVPRAQDVWIGINHLLEMFPALAFRAPQCDDGLTALAAYRTRRQGEGALSSDEPVHDWASHPADALRMLAEAHRAGLLAFKHVSAKGESGAWPAGGRPQKRGVAPMRVSV